APYWMAYPLQAPCWRAARRNRPQSVLLQPRIGRETATWVRKTPRPKAKIFVYSRFDQPTLRPSVVQSIRPTSGLLGYLQFGLNFLERLLHHARLLPRQRHRGKRATSEELLDSF